METLTVQQLIDGGVHFGCRASRWNPKMAPFIHGKRNLIHVIELRETLRGLIRAQNFLYHTVSEGQQILWVGTKRQIKGVIAEAGERTGMPTVTERWIGGTLTNFSVIRSRLRRLEDLEKMEEDGSVGQYSKKVISSLRREQRKILRNLAGVREMTSIPGAMVVIDPSREENAIREAKKMGLVVIGILDTDCDPDGIDIVIPGNDDALRSVRLLVETLAKAVEEGAATHRERMAATGAAERTDDQPMSDEPRPTRTRPIPRQIRSMRPVGPMEDDEGGREERGARNAERTTGTAIEPAPETPAAETPAAE